MLITRTASRRLEEDVVNAEGRFLSLLESIRSPGQHAEMVRSPFAAVAVFDQGTILDALKQRLYDLRGLAPQKRGYEFEGFLKELFDSSKLQARSPFSRVGEQIDESVSSEKRRSD